MKKNEKKLIGIMSVITGVLLVTTLVLMFTIGPWKKATLKSSDVRSAGKATTEVKNSKKESSKKSSSSGEPIISNGEWDVTDPSESEDPWEDPTEDPTSETWEDPTEDPETTPSTEETTEETTTETTPEPTTETTLEPTTETTPEPTEPPETTKSEPHSGGSYDLSGMVIVIDPGHQRYANSDQEPVAPWSDETKAKVSAGTSGVSTGRPEYEVTLEIGLRMRDVLESMGATVIMTRTSNDVDISNIERAQIAVDNDADVFLRLHCDASDSSSARGIGVFVCSRGELADSQVKWGNWLGNCLADATGSKYRGCDASTRYSGLNWATSVPSFLLEMGFMSNSDDDWLLSDPDYQELICQGVAAFCNKMKNR